MKFIPRRNQAMGRIVIKRVLSSIVRPDETRDTTKFVLIDGVGADAQAAGIKVGDIVLVSQLNNFILDGGALYRPIINEKDIMFVVADLGELAVQTENGRQYVPFGSKDAARSICEDEIPSANGAISAAPEARA